jgi:hypothetical protein
MSLQQAPDNYGHGHRINCYMLFARVAFVSLLLQNSVNSLASNVFDIDKARILQIATEAAYLENEDLKPGDLDRQHDILLINCYAAEECRAIVDFRIVPTITRTTRQEEDGRCWKKLEYETVSVRVFPNGKYQIRRDGGTGDRNTTIDCELLD